jgi:hypothetical protein
MEEGQGPNWGCSAKEKNQTVRTREPDNMRISRMLATKATSIMVPRLIYSPLGDVTKHLG